MTISALRPAVALVLCATVVAAGAATAAPAVKPSCNLVEDAKGDTFLLRSQDTAGAYGPTESALDIVSADLSANAKSITAVIRVDKLSKSAGTAPGGLSFRVQFATPTENDENLYLNATTSGGTDVFTAGTRAITANLATKTADVTGVFDTVKNEIRITAPLSTFAAQGVKPGALLTLAGLDQTASRNAVAGKAVFADVATSEKSYKVGAPSCVVPGK